jgi:hypothetical protein
MAYPFVDKKILVIKTHFRQWRHANVQSVPKKEPQGSVF